jgi:hypothetical protein
VAAAGLSKALLLPQRLSGLVEKTAIFKNETGFDRPLRHGWNGGHLLYVINEWRVFIIRDK